MSDRRERRLLWFFAVVYFTEGMAGLAYEPVDYLLKDVLHLGPSQAAAFIVWMTLPLTIKPIFGLLTDLLPWSGRRRFPHLLAMSLVTSAAWMTLSGLHHYSYGPTLALLILVNVGFVCSDIVCDGVMVERGKEAGKTGPYQAVQLGVLYATLVLTGVGAGWLTTHATYKVIFLLAGCFPLLTAAAGFWIDEPEELALKPTVKKGIDGVRSLLRSRRAWAVAAAIFLWDFSPFLGTAQFYYQSESMRLSPQFIGWLTTAGGLAGVVGAAMFSRFNGGSAKVARWSVLIGAPLSLLYLGYIGPLSIVALTVLFACSGVFFRLSWMDLAAQSCPEGAEATSFAAFMAVFNIAASASNWLGGALYENLRASYGAYAAMAALSLLGTLGTLACWPLLTVASTPES